MADPTTDDRDLDDSDDGIDTDGVPDGVPDDVSDPPDACPACGGAPVQSAAGWVCDDCGAWIATLKADSDGDDDDDGWTDAEPSDRVCRGGPPGTP